MVVARLVAAVAMAFVVGFVLMLVFAGRSSEFRAAESSTGSPSEKHAIVGRSQLILIGLILLSLLLPNYLMTQGAFYYKVLVWIGFTIPVALYSWRALELTGPGLSLPNWLAIAKVFGIRKALVCVPTISAVDTRAAH